MDEPQELYAKQKESNVKDHILYNFTYMNDLGKANLQGQKINGWLSRANCTWNRLSL